jgi:predicted metal-dependent hydrolase
MVTQASRVPALSCGMLMEQTHFEFDALSTLDYAPQIRYSGRARRLSVRVHRNARVEVVAPPRYSQRRIAAFLREQSDWIAAQRRRVLALVPPAVEPFPPSRIELRALQQTWRVHLAGGQGALRLRVLADGVLSATGRLDDAALRKALRRWLLRHAANALEPGLQRCSQQLGLTFRRLSVRCQRSRWGSCSARGTISLNAAVLFQPPEVLEYLMIHELTHLRHPNHSDRFWSAVEQHCATWRTLDRELVAGWRHVPSWLFA